MKSYGQKFSTRKQQPNQYEQIDQQEKTKLQEKAQL